MDRCIVAAGSFARGHEFYGPFDNPKEALDWADDNYDRLVFTVVTLEEPDGRNADGEDWAGDNGRIILIIGDVHNGHAIIGMFDSPESALDYEENYEADCTGYGMWVHLSPLA